MALAETTLIEQEPVNGGVRFGAWWGVVQPREILPPWGTAACDAALRALYRALHNTLIQGAIAGKIMRIRATPWQIKGTRTVTYDAQRFLQDAHFGKGWGYTISKALLDYHTQNKGGFLLIHAPGDPLGPITGKARKIYHLDAGRCHLTGNFEYPVVYHSRRTGKLHRLYKDRVIHFVDTPDASEEAFDMGMCALYRMASVANIQVMLGKYQTERLDNLPPAGILTISGISDGQFRLAMQTYDAERTRDGASLWRNVLRLHAVDPNNPLKVESLPFATLPEHFDFREYVNIHVNMVALALGLDRQDVWTLDSGGLGTATQSKVLAEKSRGKGIADCLAMLEREINRKVLPPELEFKFQQRDLDAEREEAERAKLWVETVNAAPIGPAQKLEILAANVEAFRDALLNPDGTVKLPDADVRPEPSGRMAIAQDGAPVKDGI